MVKLYFNTHKLNSWKKRWWYIRPSILKILEELALVLSLGFVEMDLGALKAEEEYVRLCFKMGVQP